MHWFLTSLVNYETRALSNGCSTMTEPKTRFYIYDLLPSDAIHRAADCYSLAAAYAMSDAFIHVDTRIRAPWYRAS